MAIPTREPFVVYLFARAATFRRHRDVTPESAAHLELHALALERLAETARSLPEDDERLLMLGTLTVRKSQFTPGAGTEHALTQYAATSSEECDAFLTNLVRIARDDSLARARAQGHLPPERPR